MQLMYQRVSEAPRDPRSLAPELPEWLANLILRCLAKDPAERYQSASDLLRDLDAMQAAAPGAAGNQTISIQIPKPGRRGWMAIVSTFAALVGIVSAVPKARDAFRSIVLGKQAEGIQQRIAVLPLNIAGADDLAYVADGVRDSLMAKLSGLRDVYLADDAAVAAAVRNQKDPQKLAKALGVTLLARGTLQTSGDKISVALRVDDTASGKTLFQRDFSGVRQDLLTIQDQVFSALSAALVIRQSEEERARNALRPTGQYTAYDLYLRGASLLRGRKTVATAQQALDFFDHAIKIDPLFALAYAGTTDASMVIWRATRQDEWIQRATSAAEQSARLNDNLPQAHYALGTVYANAGKTAEAIGELRRALQLAPNSDEGYRRLGIAYKRAGQLENAARAFETAIGLNRYNANNYNQAGAVYFSLGENQKALAAYQRVVELNPEDGDGRGNLATAHYRLGHWDEAIAEFQRAIPKNPAYSNNLGVVYYFLGRYAEAEKAFEAAVASSPFDPTYLQSLADTYYWSGQKDKAAAAYRRAIDAALKTLKTDPKSKEAMAVLAGCYAHLGDPARALQFIRQARQIDEQDNDLMYREAVVHAMAQRWPESLASLRSALRSGYSLNEAKADPELKALREKPEFSTLLAEVSKRSTP
jgi:tetratricopeptide (TPR) repeat protein/TolB-like protein